jgi:hypothetical protein
VEVAETKRQYDTMRKPRAYARSGIAEVWVVVLDRDRGRDRIEVFADRARSAYRRSRICERGDELAPELYPQCQLRVTDILAYPAVADSMLAPTSVSCRDPDRGGALPRRRRPRVGAQVDGIWVGFAAISVSPQTPARRPSTIATSWRARQATTRGPVDVHSGCVVNADQRSAPGAN